MYGKNSGFVFSLDAASALLLIIFFSFFAIIYVQSIPYSSLSDYEFYKFSDTGLQTLKAGGSIGTAVEKTMAGKQAEAEQSLRKDLVEVFSGKYRKTLRIEIFDNSMNKLKEISITDPEKAFIYPTDRVAVVRRTFVKGEHYGITTLQVW